MESDNTLGGDAVQRLRVHTLTNQLRSSGPLTSHNNFLTPDNEFNSRTNLAKSISFHLVHLERIAKMNNRKCMTVGYGLFAPSDLPTAHVEHRLSVQRHQM